MASRRANTPLTVVEGRAGLSAYQIAVRNGYVGSEEQWIASIGAGEYPTPGELDFTLIFNNGLV